MKFWHMNFKAWLSCVDAKSFFGQLFPKGSILPNLCLLEENRTRERKLKTLMPNSALRLSAKLFFLLPVPETICQWDRGVGTNIMKILTFGHSPWKEDLHA